MIYVVSYFLLASLFWLIARPRDRAFFIGGAFFLIWILSSVRSVDSAPDTAGYVAKYELLPRLSFADVFDGAIGVGDKDVFFYIFSKLFADVGVPAQGWLAALAAIYIFSVGSLVFRYSPNALLSILMFVALNYFYFSFSGLRQAMALSLVIASFKYVLDKRFLPTLFLVLVATAFHRSAIVFLLIFPFLYVNIKWIYLPAIVCAFLAATYLGESIKAFIFVAGWGGLEEYAESEDVLNHSGFIIQTLIFSFCFMYRDKVVSLDSRFEILFKLLFLGVIFQAFSVVVAEFFRISMYFNIFSLIVVPIVTSRCMGRSGIVAGLAIYIVLFLYLFKSGVYYDLTI